MTDRWQSTSRIVRLTGIQAELHLMAIWGRIHLDHLVRDAEQRLGLPITERASFTA